MKVELVPDISCCIETVAKREFHDAMSLLLSADTADVELKAKAEILERFMRTADFRKLRSESEVHLRQGKKVSFIIYLEDRLVKHDMLIQASPY